MAALWHALVVARASILAWHISCTSAIVVGQVRWCGHPGAGRCARRGPAQEGASELEVSGGAKAPQRVVVHFDESLKLVMRFGSSMYATTFDDQMTLGSARGVIHTKVD